MKNIFPKIKDIALRAIILLLSLGGGGGGLLPCSMMAQERIYLSGPDSEHTRTWQFFCSDGQNSGKWCSIEVPSCWEQQGFGAYTYGRFYKTKGLKESRETGRYKVSFSVPKTSAGKVLRLVFEGSMTDTQVWIDGKSVGARHQGGFTEFSYDITSLVTPGKKQTLEVLVAKESANKSVNSAERRADWWLFGGIYRPVYIEVLPQQHIKNLAIDARANGDVFVNQKGLTMTLDGRNIPYDEKAGCYHCGNIRQWDPEHPNLYTATFTTSDGQHSKTQRIGFRTIEFREHDGIYLNGTRLVVKGTNRHCFDPETGRAMSRERDLQDARLIRQMNMNAVRCHYPPDSRFLSICDSVGLLFLAELPGWQTHYDDTTSARIQEEMILRDQNHPCIFLWSNGNEGGWNTTIDSRFAELDIQKRHVVHPWADYAGIDTHHYPAYQTGAYRLHNGQNVFMPTEFLHSKYDKGGGAALEDMWNHWTASPLFAGGFIWAYLDEAVRRTDMPTGRSKSRRIGGKKGFDIKDCILDSDGGNGPDGCMDPYRQPEASFYTIREVWSPIFIDRLYVTPSFNGRFLVSNRYLFTNLKECSMTYRVTSPCHSQGGRSVDSHCIAQGEVVLPELEPGESGYAHFDLPANFLSGDILEVTAYDRNKEEVCTWTAPIHRADEQMAGIDLSKAKPVEKGLDVILVGMSNSKTAKETSPNDQTTNIPNAQIKWYELPDGRLYMDARILYDERTALLTEESKWQLGISISYAEDQVDSVRWEGRGPYRVWRNRLKGQQYGVWQLAYNNTVTGQYNSADCPVYPEFKGYRSDIRWVDIINKDKSHFKVTSLTEGLYLRLFTPEEAVDQTPGEMGGLQEGTKPKSERTMVKFPEGDISFLLSIPPMQSYKPLEQLGPQSQPHNIRIKSGDEGFHIRLVFEHSMIEP